MVERGSSIRVRKITFLMLVQNVVDFLVVTAKPIETNNISSIDLKNTSVISVSKMTRMVLIKSDYSHDEHEINNGDADKKLVVTGRNGSEGQILSCRNQAITTETGNFRLI